VKAVLIVTVGDAPDDGVAEGLSCVGGIEVGTDAGGVEVSGSGPAGSTLTQPDRTSALNAQNIALLLFSICFFIELLPIDNML
jgi:hypothetical protein